MTAPDLVWLECLADQIRAHDPQSDARTIARAKTAIIHSFGRTLAGARTAKAKSLLEMPGVASGVGSSLVFGTERRISASDSALVNSAAVATGSESRDGALSAAYIVSLFGLCEEHKKTGKEFVDAVISGAQASHSFASKVASLNPATNQLQPAVFGVVAAATRVMNLSQPRTAAALRIGAEISIGGYPADHAAWSGLLIGLGMKNGLLTAALAGAIDEKSYVANPRYESPTASSSAATAPAGAADAAHDLLVVPSGIAGDLWDWFEGQAGAVLPRDQIAPLLDRLETIDKATELATVSRMLQGRPTQAATTKIVFAPRGAHEPEETNWVP